MVWNRKSKIIYLINLIAMLDLVFVTKSNAYNSLSDLSVTSSFADKKYDNSVNEFTNNLFFGFTFASFSESSVMYRLNTRISYLRANFNRALFVSWLRHAAAAFFFVLTVLFLLNSVLFIEMIIIWQERKDGKKRFSPHSGAAMILSGGKGI